MNLGFLTEEQLNVFNPIFIMVLIPVFEKFIYPGVERTGYKFTLLRRMGVGMLLAALSFFMSAAVQYQMDSQADNTVQVWWQLPQIFTISCAEILVSITGLEFAYEQAGPSMKATLMALFLATTGIGDSVAGALFNSLAPVLSSAQMALFFACLMILNFLVFLWVAIRFKPSSANRLANTLSVTQTPNPLLTALERSETEMQGPGQGQAEVELEGSVDARPQ